MPGHEPSAEHIAEYEELVRLWQAGRTLLNHTARIEELRELYGDDEPKMPLLATIHQSVKSEESVDSQLQTYATDAARDEAARFADSAKAIRDRLARETRRSALPIGEWGAEFLGIEAGSHPTEDLRYALATTIRERLTADLRPPVAAAMQAGKSWAEVDGIYRKQCGAMAALLPADAEDTWDALLQSNAEVIHELVEAEHGLAAMLSEAQLATAEERYTRLADALRGVHSTVFESAETLPVNLLANTLEAQLRAVELDSVTERVRAGADELATGLELVRARSARDSWVAVVLEERRAAAASARALDSLDEAVRLLGASVANRIGLIRRPNWLAGLGAFVDLDDQSVRHAWARMVGDGGPDLIGALMTRIASARTVLREALKNLPPDPPAADGPMADWQRWVDAARAVLRRYFDAAGLAEAAERAERCVEATSRELAAWRVRQSIPPAVLAAIDSGSPVKKIATAARKAGEKSLAEALGRVSDCIRQADGWTDVAASLVDLSPDTAHVVCYALSKDASAVEAVTTLLLGAAEVAPGPTGWQPIVDVVGDTAPLWSGLLRFVTGAWAVLRTAVDSLGALLRQDDKGELQSKLSELLAAHASLREVDPAQVRADAFGSSGARVRTVLGRIELDRQRTLVRLESRIALLTVVELVPLERPDPRLRPLWLLSPAETRDKHLPAEWVAVLRASDQLYWQTRRLAPVARRKAQKPDFALLGLTETLHLSPAYLSSLDRGDGTEERVPTSTEVYQAVVATYSGFEGTKPPSEELAWLRGKLESQLRHLGLGLLTLDLRPHSPGAINHAKYVADRVRAGFNAGAGTVTDLRRLRHALQDAQWTRHRFRRLQGGQDAGVAATVASKLDGLPARDGHTLHTVAELVQQALDFEAGASTAGDAFPTLAHETLLAALRLGGSRSVGDDALSLGPYAITCLQGFARRLFREHGMDVQAYLTGELRGLVVRAPDKDVLLERLGWVRFLAPNDEGAMELERHAHLLP